LRPGRLIRCRRCRWISYPLSGAQATGGSGSDTFAGIERLVGSTHADTLTGDSSANRLEGRNGNDALLAGFGNDSLTAAVGADFLADAPQRFGLLPQRMG
jgi:serralysin